MTKEQKDFIDFISPLISLIRIKEVSYKNGDTWYYPQIKTWYGYVSMRKREYSTMDGVEYERIVEKNLDDMYREIREWFLRKYSKQKKVRYRKPIISDIYPNKEFPTFK